MRLWLALALTLLLFAPSMAKAACTSPTGVEGMLVYNHDYNLVQYCDANNAWVRLGGGTLDARIGALTANKWCAANAGGTGFDCTQNAPAATAGTNTQVIINDGGSLAGAANMLWLKTLNANAGGLRLGSTSAPTVTLDVTGSEAISGNSTIGGTLGVTGNTSVDTSSLFVDATAHAVDIGTVTSVSGSLLNVASGGYAQFAKTFAGAPTAGDCAGNTQKGRLTYDTTNGRFYFCDGVAWTYTSMGTSGAGLTGGTAGYIPYWSSATALASDTTAGGQLFWDSTNHSMGLGTATPSTKAVLELASTTKGFLPPRMTSTQRDAITSPAAGLMIYNITNAQFEFYSGTAWNGIGSTTAGEIAAFAATSCPTGWTEYTAARGRFLRGIDSSGSTTMDPSGTRAPGSVQADTVGPHNHTDRWLSSGTGSTVGYSGITGTLGNGFTVANNADLETRPKNVAVIFCSYNGSGNVPATATVNGTTNYVAKFTGAQALGNSMIYDNGTNVGIGTTSPSATMDVFGNIFLSKALPEIDFNGTGLSISGPAANTLAVTTSGIERLRINNTGNVGIGVTSPVVMLDVSGNIRGSNFFPSGSNFPNLGGSSTLVCVSYQRDITGSYTMGYCTGSDRRLKTNIEDSASENGLAAIEQLRAVSFNWKDAQLNRIDGPQIGFVAQDVQKVFPQFVSKNGPSVIKLADGREERVPDTLTVNYAKFVVPLVKAVQELKTDNNDLRAVVDKQGEEIKALKASIH